MQEISKEGGGMVMNGDEWSQSQEGNLTENDN
jgi:hypothetical protein